MGVGSKFFASDECRILRSSRGRGCLRGKPLRVSFRFSIKAAAGGRFAAQIENAPKRSTTRVGGVSFCRVLIEKMLIQSHALRWGFSVSLYKGHSIFRKTYIKQSYSMCVLMSLWRSIICSDFGLNNLLNKISFRCFASLSSFVYEITSI